MHAGRWPAELILTRFFACRQAHTEGCDRLREIDVSHVLAEAVRRSHFGESVSALFTSVPWTEVSIQRGSDRLGGSRKSHKAAALTFVTSRFDRSLTHDCSGYPTRLCSISGGGRECQGQRRDEQRHCARLSHVACACVSLARGTLPLEFRARTEV